MRILIVKISAMGDVLHALPVLDYLKQASPGCEIDWVVEEAFAGLLSGNPLISELHTVRFKQWKRQPLANATAKEIITARNRLAARNYGLVIDLQGNIKSGIVAWLTGCRQRVGFCRRDAQESLNTLFINHRIPLQSQDRHITDQYLRIASAFFDLDFRGLKLHCDVGTDAEHDRIAEDLIRAHRREGPVLLIHTGTTWQTKFWHEPGWTELCSGIIATFPGAMLLFSWGNDSERSAAMRITSAVGSQAIVLDRMPIHALAALVKKVDLVIGGDTGIVHLAAAVGTPTVSYYRSSDGQRSGPRGDRHGVVQAPMTCACCFRTRCAKDRECRLSITPGMLLHSIKQIL